jgi:2-polyprenyl-3-methyl-5-hydroxy-6-metoxy-1,4-benzoquinol methylase
MQALTGSRRFAVGRNWRRYVDGFLDDEKFARAQAQTSAFLRLGNLNGKRFLDIGCGSGLFSFVAHRMGAAEIISVDVDPDSMVATSRVFERAGSPPNWHIMQGSILDREFLAGLPRADVVYAWGVLHHTGAMWDALRNAAELIQPGGLLHLAIYNKQEYETMRSWRGSYHWLRIKKIYNTGGPVVRLVLETWYKGKDIVRMLIRLKNPLAEIWRYSSRRGMRWSVDTTDWLGGLPYEFVGVDEVFNFCQKELRLELQNLKSTIHLGPRFLFERQTGRTVIA